MTIEECTSQNTWFCINNTDIIKFNTRINNTTESADNQYNFQYRETDT